ncbi:hypothetical protein PG993_013947 [Apiospora rasikravindrae]|uniref:Uncharacterized protein n=1 Tax=Apiospora rasikravindrae TaxID=990691 RepID=A0ABR1RRM2_9PEZI
MDFKRAFPLLLLVPDASALAIALPERLGRLGHIATSNDPTSEFMTPASASAGERVITRRASRLLEKRDYYTCYRISPSPVIPDDCEKIVERVQCHDGGFDLLPGTCLVWMEGTCKARFCAGDEVTYREGLNQTFQWVGEQLGHLFRYCVVNGQDGLKGDCEDLNGGCGFYRVHLGHRGREVLNITGTGV